MIEDYIGWILMAMIFLLVATTAIISSAYDLRDKYEVNFFKSLTSNGWLVLIFSFCTLILSFVQNVYLERKTRNEANFRDSVLRSSYERSVENVTSNYNIKTKELKDAYDTSAIELKSRYDTSTTNIIKALADYGLTYNRRTDSIERLISNNRSPEPDFDFCMDAFKVTDTTNDPVRMLFSFCSDKATSSKINVICHIVFHLKNGAYIYGGSRIPLPKDEATAADKGTQVPIIIQRNAFQDSKELFVVLKGAYTNKDGSKLFSINKISAYDIINKKSGDATVYFDEKVREVLLLNGIQ